MSLGSKRMDFLLPQTGKDLRTRALKDEGELSRDRGSTYSNRHSGPCYPVKFMLSSTSNAARLGVPFLPLLSRAQRPTFLPSIHGRGSAALAAYL